MWVILRVVNASLIQFDHLCDIYMPQKQEVPQVGNYSGKCSRVKCFLWKCAPVAMVKSGDFLEALTLKSQPQLAANLNDQRQLKYS